MEAAAEALGYTANVSAQATARGRSPVIALLVADIADPYFGLIASGVARGADEQGLVVTVAITERDPAREARIVRALRGQRPQGLILAASRTQEEGAETARELAEFTRLGAVSSRSARTATATAGWRSTTGPGPPRSAVGWRNSGIARQCSSGRRRACAPRTTG